MQPPFPPQPPLDVVPPPDADEDNGPEPTEESRPITYRGSGSDPTFGYLIALALALGLTPLIPANSDMRYTIVWGVMAGFAVLSWLLGSMTRITQELPEDLAWGVAFGVILGAPLLLVGGETLSNAVERLFSTSIEGQLTPLPNGVVLAYVVFVMPLAETLFFRGLIQDTRPFWLVGALSTVWSLLLFAPMLDVFNFPGVTVLVGVALVMMNLMYGYVRNRNGLAAAWLCQITVNILLFFFPYLTRT